MSFVRIRQFSRPLAVSLRAPHRFISLTPFLRTTAGYGDPQDEKIANNTPLPSSTPDPQPEGQGAQPGTRSGSTDPEVKVKKGKTSSASKTAGPRKGKRETKKIGEEPKHEEDGGMGPVGG